MNGLITENVKVLNHCLARVEYLCKGSYGDHNIIFQNKCNLQDNQCYPFHTQVSGEIICPLLNQSWSKMGLVQR